MTAAPLVGSRVKTQDKGRALYVKQFWRFSASRAALKDTERLIEIKKGLSAKLGQALRLTFSLQDRNLEVLLNSSVSTLERRRRADKVLDPVASERLDRIAAVCHLAEDVFESQDEATRWMSSANKALGGIAPIMLCETEIGAKQVRRALHAIEWGGVV